MTNKIPIDLYQLDCERICVCDSPESESGECEEAGRQVKLLGGREGLKDLGLRRPTSREVLAGGRAASTGEGEAAGAGGQGL